MTKPCRRGIGGLLLTLAFLVGLSAPDLAGFEKKLRVAADYAHVYLQPDESSPVVDTVGRGVVLSLLYGGKMKKAWYYICFKSEKSGNTKSGYILDSEVELLYDPLLTITIQEEMEGLRIQYPPRNFDEMSWGITKKQVVESEGKPTWQTKARGGDVLLYAQKVINYDCDVEYCFAANRLQQTKFNFTGESRDQDACLDDYRKVKDALIRKFGKPLEESMDWRDSSLREDFASWATAVGLGQLELSSRWVTPKTEITARLAGGDGETSLVVLFAGRRLQDLARVNQEED
jgi:hypothetical protein